MDGMKPPGEVQLVAASKAFRKEIWLSGSYVSSKLCYGEKKKGLAIVIPEASRDNRPMIHERSGGEGKRFRLTSQEKHQPDRGPQSTCVCDT